MSKKLMFAVMFGLIAPFVSLNAQAKAAPAAKEAEKTVEYPAVVPFTECTQPGPQIKPGAQPALTDEKSWTMVIVPDTQTYVKQIENQGILDMMFAWIVRRRAEMNIQQVLFTGDLVYSNDTAEVNQKKGVRFADGGGLRDLVADEQWKAFSRLAERLDGEVPYILCTGNHDYGYNSAENRNSFFGKYFPTDRNPLTRRQLVSSYYNSFGVKTLENAAYEFIAPDGRKFLIISLQFAPRDSDLKWAGNVANMPRFADHIGILLTHSYILGNGERLKKENYAVNRNGGNAGEGIYQKLIYPCKNIRIVFSGHVCDIDNWEKSVGFSMTKNSAGKNVAQMVFNTQAIGGGFSGNGGDGWLRLLEFMPDGKTIKATTFSPFFFGSPSTKEMAWKTDQRNCFTFTLD